MGNSICSDWIIVAFFSALVSFLSIGVAGAVGCIVGGYVSDKIGRSNLTIIAMAVSAVSSILIGFTFGLSIWITLNISVLSTFLKSKRANIQPQSVGLPAGTRRRTPGLRREEVAQLAGVSTTWYTWLEQGRDIRVSSSVLDSIAMALQLNNDERKYLYDLALEVNTNMSPQEVLQTKIPSSLEKILAELKYCPTLVTDRHFHIVGWNRAAAHVFLDFEQVPVEERNLIRLVFTRKELRSLAVNWEHFVKGFLAIFRAYYGKYVGDDWYDQFLADMTNLHPEFQSLWQENKVSMAPEVLIEFRHAKAGKMLYNLTSFQVQGNNDLWCSVYTPVEESSTEVKLKRLMEKSERA